MDAKLQQKIKSFDKRMREGERLPKNPEDYDEPTWEAMKRLNGLSLEACSITKKDLGPKKEKISKLPEGDEPPEPPPSPRKKRKEDRKKIQRQRRQQWKNCTAFQEFRHLTAVPEVTPTHVGQSFLI